MHTLHGPARQTRRFIALAFVVPASVTPVATLSAHDFRIVPIGLEVFTGASIELLGGTGTKVVRASPGRDRPGRSGAADESHGDVAVPGPQGVSQSDSAAAAATVERFHAALAAGDSVGAMALLTPDVLILESGGIETREEFRAHHLPADIAYATADRCAWSSAGTRRG